MILFLYKRQDLENFSGGFNWRAKILLEPPEKRSEPPGGSSRGFRIIVADFQFDEQVIQKCLLA